MTIDQVGRTLEAAMRTISGSWNDAQSARIERELIVPLVATAMTLSHRADDALETVARAKDDL